MRISKLNVFNHRKGITSCFDGLNQSRSILPCIVSGFTDHKPGLLPSLGYYSIACYAFFSLLFWFGCTFALVLTSPHC